MLHSAAKCYIMYCVAERSVANFKILESRGMSKKLTHKNILYYLRIHGPASIVEIESWFEDHCSFCSLMMTELEAAGNVRYDGQNWNLKTEMSLPKY